MQLCLKPESFSYRRHVHFAVDVAVVVVADGPVVDAVLAVVAAAVAVVPAAAVLAEVELWEQARPGHWHCVQSGLCHLDAGACGSA